ncbi:MAG: hypothetical protein BWY42_00916 [Candidatus Omnitrophica bacterium ADurb.Bin277]|nr:MAG: hypothetical protein BWY42_00916 [Candidatus Omnitrophica bacterium ADurb.Bin277]
MKTGITLSLPVIGLISSILLNSGCATNQQQILAADQSQVALRSIQSRAFDTSDKKLMMRSVINTMQDIDFLIQDSSLDLGTVTGQKFHGNTVVKMSVTIKERNAQQLLVRANVQYGLKAIEDPKTYQDFFVGLEKSVFLTAQQVD